MGREFRSAIPHRERLFLGPEARIACLRAKS
jgi:hypothetical protein